MRKKIIDEAKLERELKAELARRSYVDYLDFVTLGQWKPLPHTKPVTDLLDRIANGEKGIRAIINMPPQVGKSFTISENFPAYYLGKFPDKQVMIGAYSDHLVSKFGRSNRNAMATYGRELFGRGVDPRNSSEKEFGVEGRKGIFYGVTVRGGATGEGCDLLIIDDPIKNREEANSQLMRDKIYDEFQSSFSTRLRNDESGEANVLIVMTRWHEDDLCGRLMKEGGWEQIVIRAVAEEGDILGREIGEPIAPFPPLNRTKEWADKTERSIGTFTWAGLYQQRPAPAGGTYFKRAWLQNYYDVVPAQFDAMGISVDCTFKKTETSDFVCMQVWGRLGSGFYLVYNVNERMGFTETLDELIRLMKLFPQAYLRLIEDKANGSAVIDVLSVQIAGLVPIDPDGGKEARANAVQPFFRANNVFLPHPDSTFTFYGANGLVESVRNSWVLDYQIQLQTFPNATNDDMVDATTQILNYWGKPQDYVYGLPTISGI